MTHGERFDDEPHTMRLIEEFRSKGLATVRQLPKRKTDADCPDFLFVTITAEGKRAWNDGNPIDSDIDDGRGDDDWGVKP